MSNGQAVDSSSLGQSSTLEFSPSRTSVAINALWFLSLSLSVSVSLIAMLSKSWCSAFMSKRTGPKYEQGRRRQLKWAGIEWWGMQSVFVYLPALMHLALLLFAVGLALYLWDMNIPVAAPVVALAGMSVLVYAAATLLPLAYEDCPYSTPISKPLKYTLNIAFQRTLPTVRGYVSSLARQLRAVKRVVGTLSYTINGASRDNWVANRGRLKDVGNVELGSEDLSAQPLSDGIWLDETAGHMFLWLIEDSEDQRLVDITLQSLGGARGGLLRPVLVERNVVQVLLRAIDNCFMHDVAVNRFRLKPMCSTSTVLLYARALSWLTTSDEEYGFGFDDWSAGSRQKSQVFSEVGPNKMLIDFYSKFRWIFDCMESYGIAEISPEEVGTSAAVISVIVPLLHQYDPVRLDFSPRVNRAVAAYRSAKGITYHSCADVATLRWIERVTTTLRTDILLAFLEAIPHCIFNQYTDLDGDLTQSRKRAIVAIVRLVHSPACASVEHQHAIGLSLTTFAMLLHPYPGWKYNLNDDDDYEARAVEMYGYHKIRRYEHSRSLIAFGLLGILCSDYFIETATFIIATLKQLGPLPQSPLGIHTLPDTFSLKQMTANAMVKLVRATITSECTLDIATTFENVLFLSKAISTNDSRHRMSVPKLRARPLCNTWSMTWQVCFGVLVHDYYYGAISLSQLVAVLGEPPDSAIVNRLISVSLGQADVYATPAAMSLLWMLVSRTTWLSDEPHQDPIMAPFVEMIRKTEALPADISATLASQQPDTWPEVFVDMWHPLLEEMCSWKTTAKVVHDIQILKYTGGDFLRRPLWYPKIQWLMELCEATLNATAA